jgi:hypothetical protein
LVCAHGRVVEAAFHPREGTWVGVGLLGVAAVDAAAWCCSPSVCPSPSLHLSSQSKHDRWRRRPAKSYS